MHVELLTATEASSDDATVTATTHGFRVVLPDDTSEQTPARVQLSFAVPQGLLSGETMLALDAGYFVHGAAGRRRLRNRRTHRAPAAGTVVTPASTPGPGTIALR